MPHPSRCLIFAFALFLSCGGSKTPPVASGPLQYVDIPAKYDFPASSKYLQHIRETSNVVAQRRHGWQIFAGLTSTTAQGLPVFETWYTKDVTFAPDESTQALRQTNPSTRLSGLTTPRQFIDARGSHPGEPMAEAVLSDIMFNRAAYEHVRHNRLYLKKHLTEINDSFKPGTPWEQRSVPFFPNTSVVLKIVYWPVKQDSLTPMPIWDFDPENRVSPQTPAPANPNTTWRRVVAINPGPVKGHDEYVDIEFNGTLRNKAHVVPITNLYHIRLDAQQTETLRNNPYFMKSVRLVFGPDRDIRPGDYVVVVAMHATTKEIDDWVWLSTWWHDRPDDGPLASGRPEDVLGVWRNYLLTTSYDYDLPREQDGSPHIAYNPWLEAIDPNGISSNCMTCHSRAMWPALSSVPVTRGLNNPFYNQQVFPDGKDPAYDATRTQLDFLWSLSMESDPKQVVP